MCEVLRENNILFIEDQCKTRNRSKVRSRSQTDDAKLICSRLGCIQENKRTGHR